MSFFFVACLVLGTSALFSADTAQSLLEKFKPWDPETLLIPKDVSVNDKFVEGKGSAVGHIQQIQGDVYVIHAGQNIAYKLQNGLPLFVQDTLVTSSESRLNALMNDKSLLAMAPKAKLIITESKYSEADNKRSTIMNLIWGSARFIVKKISEDPDFTVKTKTAVCGVRGTDFSVAVAPMEKTETVSALDRILTFFDPVTPAYALFKNDSLTIVLTGIDSTVAVNGVVGTETLVGPTSVAAVPAGTAAGSPTFIGPALASSVLDSIGPSLAVLSVPPGFTME